MMYNKIVFVICFICFIAFIVGIIMLFLKNKRKIGIKIAIGSFFAIIVSIFYIIHSLDTEARKLGFDDFKDYNAAKKLNIYSSDDWRSFKVTVSMLDLKLMNHLTEVYSKKEQERFEALAPTEQEKACLENLQCAGNKFSSNAAKACSQPIEQLANYKAEWTNDSITPKFIRFNWKNKKEYIISYIGDSIKFQTFSGSWQQQIYQCDYDFFHDQVIDVKATNKSLSD